MILVPDIGSQIKTSVVSSYALLFMAILFSSFGRLEAIRNVNISMVSKGETEAEAKCNIL